MKLNNGQKVYYAKHCFLKTVVTQEIVENCVRDKVYVYGRKRPLNIRKVYVTPDYLLKHNNKSLFFVVLAFVLVLVSFAMPIILTRFSIYDLTNENNAIIADTIYGLTGPFIAIAAALLTFAAFIVQKQANDIQIESMKIQEKKSSIDSFENKFFQLLQLHRDNVSSLKLQKEWKQDIIVFEGQSAIDSLEYTLNIILDLINNTGMDLSSLNKKDKQILAYLILVHGPSLCFGEYFKISPAFIKYSKYDKLISWIVESINNLSENKRLQPIDGRPYYLQNEIDEISKKKILNINQNLMDFLSKYFRQIYQTYSFIDNQTILSESEKEYYSKIFRTSLSNYEQELLFNDIISPYGKEWDEKNLIMKYKPFKNVTKYTKYAYTPKDYFQEPGKHYVALNKLGEFIDIMNY